MQGIAEAIKYWYQQFIVRDVVAYVTPGTILAACSLRVYLRSETAAVALLKDFSVYRTLGRCRSRSDLGGCIDTSPPSSVAECDYVGKPSDRTPRGEENKLGWNSGWPLITNTKRYRGRGRRAFGEKVLRLRR